MRTVNKCCMGGKFLHNIHKIPCWKLVILFEIHYWIACFVRWLTMSRNTGTTRQLFVISTLLDCHGFFSSNFFFLLNFSNICLPYRCMDIKAKNHNADEKYLSEENWWIANFPVNDVDSWNGKKNISQSYLDQWEHEHRKNKLKIFLQSGRDGIPIAKPCMKWKYCMCFNDDSQSDCVQFTIIQHSSSKYLSNHI